MRFPGGKPNDFMGYRCLPGLSLSTRKLITCGDDQLHILKSVGILKHRSKIVFLEER